MYEKLKHEEAKALTEFVKERFNRIYPKPRLFQKGKWNSRIERIEKYFLETLESGDNNFYGAVWSYFEGSDKLFLGENGMRELAERTQKEGDSWVYRKPGKDPRVIYAG